MSDYQREFQRNLESSILNKSKLFINTDELASQASEKFPELGQVTVVLPLAGRRPVYKVHPAQPALMLNAPGGPYVVSKQGRVLAYSSDTDSSLTSKLPVLVDDSGLRVDRGQIVLTSQTIEFVEQVTGQLKAAGVDVELLKLPQSDAGDLHVKIAGKPYFVKFDIRGEGRYQSGAFLAVADQLDREGKVPAEYIDVRVQGKAFYK